MKNSKDRENLLCPSYIAKPGAQLYGIVNKSGFIDYLDATIEITDTFMTEVRKGRPPEVRFRFADACAKNGCSQWENNKQECGLIDTIIDVIKKPEQLPLQPCPIRVDCRWFRQRAGKACAQCNEVIRNLETVALEQIA